MNISPKDAFQVDTVRVALLAPQHCSPLSYGAITEPFLLANQRLAQHKYHLTLITCADCCVDASVDRVDLDQRALNNLQHHDLLIVIAEHPPVTPVSNSIKKALQCYYRQQAGHILAVKAGLWWLLESGIGGSQKMVVHWSLIDDFKHSFANLAFSNELYQSEQRISSCAGQLACIDYLLDYLERHEGREIADQVSDYLCLDRVRAGNERQRLVTQLQGEDLQPNLKVAIELMENNIEEPLSTDEIAELASISRRQLERLFKRHMNTMPARHYLQLRLKRAQHLLQSTNMSIVQIGLTCGFSSGPHFSSSYKAFFHTTPREERSKHVQHHE